MTTIPAAAEAVLTACAERGLTLATAESCTGGMIAAALTAVPGSSRVVERGFVTYSNRAKEELLGVPGELLARHGAVSEEVARAMAEGALARSPVDLAVSVTGIAGPTGGTADKPMGLVYIAGARRGRPAAVERHLFAGDRDAVRRATVEAGLALLLRLAEGA